MNIFEYIPCSECWLTQLAILILAIAAGVQVVKTIVAALSTLYATFVRKPYNLAKRYGGWAVVTGGTDGIGKAYAHELARHGMNIFLISRSEEKLENTKAEIESKHGVQVRTLAIDFSGDETIYVTIEQALSELEGDIGFLLNNVGISYDHPEFFTELPEDRLSKLVHINIIATNEMTRIVLPKMLKRDRRHKGAIVNVASGSGLFPTPLLTAYSASKAYVDFLSQGLHQEYASKGVFVQSLAPLFVVSKLSKMRPGLFSPRPEVFARHAIATVGHEDVTAGFWLHDLQLWVARSVLPKAIRDSQLFKMHMSLRKRALKKKEREAKSN